MLNIVLLSALSFGNLVDGLQLGFPFSQYLPSKPKSSLSSLSDVLSSNNAKQQIDILKLENINNNGDGSYSYAYETANGISARESGQLKNTGSPSEAQSAQGSFKYIAPDNQQISVTYIADENGFRPQGDHLPTPPPIPAAILKSIEFNKVESAKIQYNIPKAVLPLQTDGYKY